VAYDYRRHGIILGDVMRRLYKSQGLVNRWCRWLRDVAYGTDPFSFVMLLVYGTLVESALLR